MSAYEIGGPHYSASVRSQDVEAYRRKGIPLPLPTWPACALDLGLHNPAALRHPGQGAVYRSGADTEAGFPQALHDPVPVQRPICERQQNVEGGRCERRRFLRWR